MRGSKIALKYGRRSVNAASSAPKIMALKTRAVINVLLEAEVACSARLCDDLGMLSIWRIQEVKERAGLHGRRTRTDGIIVGAWLFMYPTWTSDLLSLIGAHVV